MKNANTLTAYVLIGLGLYFLLQKFNIEFFQAFFGWYAIVGIIGLAFLLSGYTGKRDNHIFVGVILLGLSIHFYGLENNPLWYDHWSAYTLIVGIAYLFLFFKTKKGIVLAIIFLSISFLMIFSITITDVFDELASVIELIETFWPLLLIFLGIYFIQRKKQ